jgi:hypothetical protein
MSYHFPRYSIQLRVTADTVALVQPKILHSKTNHNSENMNINKGKKKGKVVPVLN